MQVSAAEKISGLTSLPGVSNGKEGCNLSLLSGGNPLRAVGSSNRSIWFITEFFAGFKSEDPNRLGVEEVREGKRHGDTPATPRVGHYINKLNIRPLRPPQLNNAFKNKRADFPGPAANLHNESSAG